MAVTVICGETEAEAEAQALPLRVAYARLATGERGSFPSLSEARAHRFTERELVTVQRFSQGAIVGGPARVREGLERLASEMGASELMISTVMPSPEERFRSYERVAEGAGLLRPAA